MKSPPLEVHLAAIGLLGLALVGGCSVGRYEVEVGFRRGVDPEDVRFIELLVLSECPSPTEVLSGEPPESPAIASVGLSQSAASLPSLGSLPAGSYGLYGRGFDTSCTAVVAGCVTVQIRDDAREVLTLELEPTLEVRACTPDTVCMDGECVVDPDDACNDFPCGLGEYCTDLADPAPVDSTGRICAPFTDCAVGQFEAAGPTTRSDRVCEGCRVCAMDDLEVVPCADGNAPNDRVCASGDRVCTVIASQDGEATSFISTLILAPSGTRDTMRVTDDGLGLFPFYSFVQFDLSNAACEEGGMLPPDAIVQSAVLQLTRVDGCLICGREHALERVSGGWNESNVTSGLGPDVEGLVSATFEAPEQGAAATVSGPQLIADVQDMIDFPSENHGWRIEQVESPANPLSPFRWATRESGSPAARPRLIVTYAEP